MSKNLMKVQFVSDKLSLRWFWENTKYLFKNSCKTNINLHMKMVNVNTTTLSFPFVWAFTIQKIWNNFFGCKFKSSPPKPTSKSWRNTKQIKKNYKMQETSYLSEDKEKKIYFWWWKRYFCDEWKFLFWLHECDVWMSFLNVPTIVSKQKLVRY